MQSMITTSSEQNRGNKFAFIPQSLKFCTQKAEPGLTSLQPFLVASVSNSFPRTF